MAMPLISERFVRPKVSVLVFKGKGRTQQQFKKDADINNIMKKYRKTGLLMDPNVVPTRKPMFGDFVGFDFVSMFNKIKDINAAFDRLPAKTREFFDNNPSALLDFMADDKNNEKAVELGLKDKSVLPAPEKPVALKSETTPPATG